MAAARTARRSADAGTGRGPAKEEARDAAAALLAWYDRHRRAMPWRPPPGRAPDPYRTWLSEIMLQQTTVAAVRPYYEAFVRRWPTVRDLAAADRDDVLHAWAGLGYYARARNLHACARIVAERHGGAFPDTEDALRRLPGIGPYTAAAVAAIAFGRKATPVDGNVERVTARLFAVETPLPEARPVLAERAAELTPDERCGDHAQATMDLGATICTARNPACAPCPVRGWCAARERGVAADLPRRSPKPARPRRHGVAFWIVDPDGAVLLRRRPEAGLLGGLMEVPTTEWRDRPWPASAARAAAPVAADWTLVAGVVRHAFTHFRLDLEVLSARVPRRGGADGVWCRPERFGEHALPTVMRKVARLAAGAAR